MASTQAGSTDAEYLAIPNYGPRIGYFKSKLTWSGGTTTGDFIPPDESGIQRITEVQVHNLTSQQVAPLVAKSYDSTEDKEKITLTGVADQTWLVIVKGIVR
jgi:hypothetical protein